MQCRTSSTTHCCKLVQGMKPYGSLASANKSRWKPTGWKDSKLLEPSLNVNMSYNVLCVKRCVGNGLYTNSFPKNMPIWRGPLLPFQVGQCSRMKGMMSRVSSRILDECWLPIISIMTRTHTVVIVHFNIDTQNKNEVTCAHESRRVKHWDKWKLRTALERVAFTSSRTARLELTNWRSTLERIERDFNLGLRVTSSEENNFSESLAPNQFELMN